MLPLAWSTACFPPGSSCSLDLLLPNHHDSPWCPLTRPLEPSPSARVRASSSPDRLGVALCWSGGQLTPGLRADRLMLRKGQGPGGWCDGVRAVRTAHRHSPWEETGWRSLRMWPEGRVPHGF